MTVLFGLLTQRKQKLKCGAFTLIQFRGTVIHRLTVLVKRFDIHIVRTQTTSRRTERKNIKFENLKQEK